MRCFLRPVNNQKSGSAKSRLQRGFGTTSHPNPSIATEVAALVWGLVLSHWKNNNVFSQQMGLTVSTSLRSSRKSWSWFCTFDHILLVNDASLASKNGEHAFSSRRLSLKFLISGSSRMMIATGFSQLGPSDAPNSHHLWQCCSENNYPNFCRRCVVTDMLPVLFKFNSVISWHGTHEAHTVFNSNPQ